MTLPTSGAISLNNVNTELGLTSGSVIGLNSSNVRTLANKSSGAITLSNLYGKAWLPSLGNHTVWGQTDSGTATASITLSNNGTLSCSSAVSAIGDDGSYFPQWCGHASTISSTEAANYECSWVVTSGSTPGTTPGAQSTWINLGTSRTWTLTRSTSGSASSTFTLTIRRVGLAATEVSATIILKADDVTV